MLTIEPIEIAGIPALKIEQLIHKDEARPLVIFWHGWTSVKERNLYYAYLLAENGFRVILPEASGHGERENELTEQERQLGFFPVVMQSIKETETLGHYCLEQGWVKDQRISVAGTSMGAIITLGSLAVYDWIQSAVALMGTPYLVGFAQYKMTQVQDAGIRLPYSEDQINELMKALEGYDLSKQPEKLQGRPLLFWHGKQDQEVPYNQSRLFFDSYNHQEEMIMKYIGNPAAGHVVTQEGAIALRDWFLKYA